MSHSNQPPPNDTDSPHEGTEPTAPRSELPSGAHPAGVWRALAITALAASFAWIPYVVPGLETMCVLGADDALPLSRLFGQRQPVSLAGAFRHPAALVEDDDALLDRAPLPPALELTPEPASGAAPSPPSPRGQAPLPRIEPEAIAGLTRVLEDPHHAMRAFYARLGRVARGEPVLARMSVYGTSINGADRVTSQLRHGLQARFGDGGKGWVPVAAGWRYQRHQDVRWQYANWRTFVVNRGDGPLDRYGLGGVVAINRHRGARASFVTTEEGPGSRVGHYRIFHQAWPEGGRFELSVDDAPARVVDTRAEQVEDRVEQIEVPDGPHTLTLRAIGDEEADDDDHEGEDLRLYGVTMEREGPGVVVDGMALIGAFTRVLRLFDEAHLDTQIQQREPDLVAFWMGANDAVSESVPFVRDQYTEHYRGILRRFTRARPGTSCLVVSILDAGERVGGRIRTRPRVPTLVETQREVAAAEGCAFFDAYRATGGEGTMRRWYHASPRLVTADLGHLTDAGARVVGTLLHRALLQGYDQWIADGQPAP